MKSRDRCRKNIQGDRCKLELSHDGAHAGSFHIWGRGTGDKVITLKEADVPRVMRRMKRSATERA